MKTCARCKQVKEVSQFRPKKNGYMSYCHPCRKDYMKEYRAGKRKVDPNKQAYVQFMAWFETLHKP